MTVQPSLPGRREAAEREAARLRYELSRLRAKRSVRLALLAASGSVGKARATLRGERLEPDFDVIAPTTVDQRPAYPHLCVATTSDDPPFGWVAQHARVTTPGELADTQADLLVLGNSSAADSALVKAAQDLGVPVVGLGHRTPREGVELAVAVTASGANPPDGADLAVAPWVDATRDNPIGWRRDDGPIIVEPQPDPRSTTREVLRALAGGRTVVTSAVDVLPASIQPFVVPRDRDDGGGLPDATERERTSVGARRHVLTAFEALTRFEAIIEALGIPRRANPTVSVLLVTRRPGQLEHALRQVDVQTHDPIQLVLVLHGGGFPANVDEQVRQRTHREFVVQHMPDTMRFGDALNVGLDAATGDLIAKMDDDDHYGPHHLSDLVLALRYSRADIVGRWANEVHLATDDVTITRDLDREERWAHHLPGGTLLAHADILRALRFRRVDRAIDTHLLRSLHAAGGSAYAAHRFGYIRTRRGDDHTYEADRGATGATGRRPGLDTSVLDV